MTPLEQQLAKAKLVIFFRLVLLNDPAVGHWQVFNDFGRGTHFSEGIDSAAVTDVLDQAGHKVEQDFLARLKTAQQQVYSEWEKVLANNEPLSAVAVQNVLVSKKNKLAFYVAT